MGSGSSPTAPTLDLEQSASLLRQQLAIQREQLPAMSVAAGNASRQESRRNIDFGLRLLGDQRLRSSYEAALPDEMRRRTGLLGQLDAAQSSAPEYTRFQEQLQGAVGERAGMLSAQDTRDATQQARSAMAAKGMATGSAGIGAELLNRDRFVQQRRAQDLGYLGQSAQLAEQERMRKMGLGQDAYNFSMSTNPAIMAMGMGSPYANLTQNSMAMVGGAQGLNPMYSGGQFSSGGGMGAAMGGVGAALGAGIGGVLAAPTGGLSVPMGLAIGGSFGGAAGGLGGSLFK
jgi:hypothetical protein